MTTDVPPGIASPNEVETRLGKLKFFDGVPDQASAEKIYDNLDFQHAVQAYLLGLPVVNQVGNRDNILTVGPANTTVPIWEDLVDPRTVELTANNNTPYTWFWLDLRKGPLVLEAPPKVLGWSTTFGITGTAISASPAGQGRGGKYLILPPGYKDAVPEGYFVIRPGSLSVLGRVAELCHRRRPETRRRCGQEVHQEHPLAQAANPPELKFVNMSGKSFNMVAPADYRFWELLHKSCRTNRRTRSTQPPSACGQRSASGRANRSPPTRG